MEGLSINYGKITRLSDLKRSRQKREKKSQCILGLSMFSWLGDMIVLKPSLVSTLCSFKSLKQTKNRIKLIQVLEDRMEEDRGYLDLFSAVQPSRQAQTGCQCTELWEISTHTQSYHLISQLPNFYEHHILP